MKRPFRILIPALLAVFLTTSCSLSRVASSPADKALTADRTDLQTGTASDTSAAQPDSSAFGQPDSQTVFDESINDPNSSDYIYDVSGGTGQENAVEGGPSGSAGSFPGEIRLCLMGDIMCLSGQQYAASCGDGTHDYRGNYKLLQKYFDECDYVIGNLETCLAPSAPYSTESRNVDSNPNCNAPTDLLDSLTAVGITHVVTANNHSLDADTLGIAETTSSLDDHGIGHTGSQTPASVEFNDPRYMMIDSGDIRIAVIAVTELINRRYLVSDADMPSYVNTYSPEFITDSIAAAREEGATYVIVYEHWGRENTHELTSGQRENAQIIADAGADLIIGSHSHCVQPMDILTSADNRKVPCFYSLGNLISSMAKDINNDTVLVFLTLSPYGADRPGEVNASLTTLPCHVLSNYDGSSLVIAPTDFDTGDDSDNRMLAAAGERIKAVLAGTYSE